MEELSLPPNLLVIVVLMSALYLAACAIYNVTFHPLANFPGPKLRGAFDFPTYWHLCRGTSATNTHALHEKFGHVVRLAPNVLSFISAQAWRDIYGHRKGQKGLPRDPHTFFEASGTATDIIVAGDADHTRMRKLMSHAFSESALREQEPLIRGYSDLLIQRLRDQIGGPAKGQLDIVRWLNFTTFDIIGDLAFGESFHALEHGEYHFWIATICKSLKVGVLVSVARAYPLLGALIFALVRPFSPLMKSLPEHEAYTRNKTNLRLEKKTDRRDFMSYILRHNDERGMTKEEIIQNSAVLIVAGSETSSTLLSGMVFHLLNTPHVLEKLQEEVRQSFQAPPDMTFAAEARLPYLQACIEEALRLYPPIPIALPRYTPPGGTLIDGHFVPGNTTVGVHHLSASRSARNFKDPLQFVPERWLGDERYSSDDLSASQPFSLGSRSCIGRNLAYAEIRSVLTRLLWNFDMELCADSLNWGDQRVYTLWDKPPLNIKLSTRSVE